MVDWSSCAPLCQHPSCWESQRRLSRGIKSRCSSQESPIDDTDDGDGLPTQSIINLLDSYDLDPEVRYLSPAGSSRPGSDKGHYCPFHGRPISEESIRKVRAPNATPATARHSSPEHMSRASGKPPPYIGQVEVQEVFEANDLRSQWQKTFLPKQYYVWVSKPAKSGEDPATDSKPSDKVMDGVDAVSHVAPTDITERLMPREVETHRLAATGHTKKPTRSRSPEEMKTPRRSKRKKTYSGIYELLDLPKEVLAHLLEHISERDMLDKKKFADALLKALPDLMRESVSLSLAGSDVLQQKKLNILDGQQKAHKHFEPFEAKQVFQLDADVLHQMNDANSPEEPPGDAVERGSPNLPQKKTLPPISAGRKDSAGSVCRKTKLPAISLTLPDIPMAGRYTRPFTYKQNDFSFTLGRVPTPPSPVLRSNSEQGSLSSLSSVKHPVIPVAIPVARTQLLDTTPRMKPAAISRETTVTTDPGLFVTGCHPPVNTPASKSSRRPELSHIKQGQATPEVPPAILSRPPVNIPKVPFDSQPSLDIAAGLGTIQEHDSDARRKTPGSTEHHSLQPGDHHMSATQGPDNLNNSPREQSPAQFATHTAGSMSARSELSSILQRNNNRDSATPGGEETYAPSPGLSAEPWPAVSEEAYERPPSSPGKTHSGEFGMYSVLPRSPLASRDSTSVHSGQIKKILRDKVTESPGPPPPSPEPKRLSSREREGTGLILRSREPTSASILDDIAETDSEITISAKPPSCLDDESRICTPASAPAGGRSGLYRGSTAGQEGWKEPGKTVIKSELASEEKSMPVNNASKESINSTATLPDNKVPPPGHHSDSSLQKEKSNVDFQTDKAHVEHADIENQQETTNDSKDSQCEDDNHDNNQDASERNMSETKLAESRSESARVEEIQSADPCSEPDKGQENPGAYNHSTENIEIKDNDLDADTFDTAIAELDQFDANEDTFIEELKKEYDKLSD